jgi:protease-4
MTLALAIVYLTFLVMMDRDVQFGDAVAVVDIRGEIYYDRGKVAEIESYRDNDNVKALLLFINSPGGGVTASQALYHAVMSARAKKPVVAFMASVAASGGYYVACAADSILAHEGTITGSIGVIATFMRTEELFQKIGLEVTVLTTGKYKDVGSPHREMTSEERRYMLALLESAYSQFLRAIAAGRGMPVGEVGQLAEGRLYTGEEALSVGLIDRVATYEGALELAADMGGIDGEPRVIKRQPRRTLFDWIFGQAAPRLPVRGEERIRLEYIIP